MDASRSLVLDVLGTNLQFSFAVDAIDELVIGRKNPETGDTPEIDLGGLSAHYGVCRRHAMIGKKDGVLYVIDKSSASGSFLNEKRMVTEQARTLRHGDEIRLGRMVLRVGLY